MAYKWEDFLKDIVKGQNLDMSTEHGAFADIVAKPTSLMFPPVFSEIQRVLNGQSLANYYLMAEDEMDRLMANKLLYRYRGGYASGDARIYFTQPQDIEIQVGTSFTNSVGYKFVSNSKVTMSYDQASRNIEGKFFYVDVPVQASDVGESFNTNPGEIIAIEAELKYYVMVTNKSPLMGGKNGESNQEFMERGLSAQSIRDFASKWSIMTILKSKFPHILDTRVVGSGDIGMDRDKTFGIHLNGKGDIYVHTTALSETTKLIPSGTTILQIGDIPDDLPDTEAEYIISEIPLISVSHIYPRNISDINERTGEDLKLLGGYGMGAYGFGIYGQGSLSHANPTEPTIPYIDVTSSGAAKFTKNSREVIGDGTQWKSVETIAVKRGDRIQRSKDISDGYNKDFGRLYTVSEVVSDEKIMIAAPYEEESSSYANYRIQGYSLKSSLDGSAKPGAILHVRDLDNNDTSDLRYSSQEKAYIRIPREYMLYPIEIIYKTDPTIKEIQSYIDENINRVVGCDLLVKNFIPIYVDMDLTYEGGPSVDRMTPLIQTVIDRNRLWDPEAGQIRRLTNWNGTEWVFDVSDLIDMFYNQGCTYVKIPPMINAEMHFSNGGISTMSDLKSEIVIPESHHLIARDITLTQQSITER